MGQCFCIVLDDSAHTTCKPRQQCLTCSGDFLLVLGACLSTSSDKFVCPSGQQPGYNTRQHLLFPKLFIPSHESLQPWHRQLKLPTAAEHEHHDIPTGINAFLHRPKLRYRLEQSERLIRLELGQLVHKHHHVERALKLLSHGTLAIPTSAAKQHRKPLLSVQHRTAPVETGNHRHIQHSTSSEFRRN